MSESFRVAMRVCLFSNTVHIVKNFAKVDDLVAELKSVTYLITVIFVLKSIVASSNNGFQHKNHCDQSPDMTEV